MSEDAPAFGTRPPETGATVLQIPIQFPTGDAMKAILVEAAEKVIRERDHWLSIKEAAAYLRISPRTFIDFRKRWRIPVYGVGKGLIYRPHLDAVVAKLAEQPPGKTVIEFPAPTFRNPDEPAAAISA